MAWIGWSGRRVPPEYEGLREALSYLVRQRMSVPESIFYGYMEEALYDVRIELENIEEPAPLVRRPYTGLSSEADLLYNLARAMRRRMERLGTPRISGVDYLVDRVDAFTSRVQATYGLWVLGP